MHVIAFCRVVPAKWAEKLHTHGFNFENVNKCKFKTSIKMLIACVSINALNFQTVHFTRVQAGKNPAGVGVNILNIMTLVVWQYTVVRTALSHAQTSPLLI
jgi:hypothetical protein